MNSSLSCHGKVYCMEGRGGELCFILDGCDSGRIQILCRLHHPLVERQCFPEVLICVLVGQRWAGGDLLEAAYFI